MPAYRDEKHGTFYASFYYTDFTGARRKKMKRGFKLKRDAQEWERQFLLQRNADPDMKFGDFVEIYRNDKRERIREHTWESKDNMINTKILPYVTKKGVERAVEMTVYSGAYNLDELSAGVFRQSEAGQTTSAPQDGEATVVYEGYGTYSGSFANGKRNGAGTFLWENGDAYTGEWKADKPAGKGTLTLADGTVQQGTFRAGKLYSGSADIPQTDGGVLTRSVSEGEVRSAATLTWPDGTVLSGKISAKTGTFTGDVTIAYPNGDSYVGALADSLKSGKGTYTWKNGAHYTGEWKEDKMEGKGTYYFGKSEKNDYIKGQFSANAPKGTMDYVSQQGLHYNTTWRNGKCVSISAK